MVIRSRAGALPPGHIILARFVVYEVKSGKVNPPSSRIRDEGGQAGIKAPAFA
jgi:hypothetical protein